MNVVSVLAALHSLLNLPVIPLPFAYHLLLLRHNVLLRVLLHPLAGRLLVLLVVVHVFLGNDVILLREGIREIET